MGAATRCVPWLAAVIVSAGCGRLGFDERASTSTPDGATGGDASSPTADAPCALGSFGAPIHLAQLASNFDDYSPTLDGSGLHLLFESNRPGGEGGYDLYESTRPDRSTPFSAPVAIAELNDGGNESGVSVTADGLTVYFADNPGGTERLYVATRPSLGAPFGSASLVPGLESTSGWGPELSEDGLELFYGWFTSGLDVYRSTRTDLGQPFGAPSLVTELNMGSSDGFPDLHPDGLTIWFESDRTGVLQIYSAVRPSRMTPFSTPTLVAGLEDPASTGDPELSRDGTTIVFASQRAGGLGSFDLWMTTRSCQ